MSTVTGERTYSTSGKTPVRDTFPPLPAGNYELTLLGETVEVGKSDKVGSMPYVRVRFQVALPEGKTRKVSHFFACDTRPRFGSPPPDKADGICGYAKALGEEFTGGMVEVPDEQGQNVLCLDPQDLAAYLRGKDGMVTKAHLRIKKAKEGSGYSDDNSVSRFIVDTATTSSSGI